MKECPEWVSNVCYHEVVNALKDCMRVGRCIMFNERGASSRQDVEANQYAKMEQQKEGKRDAVINDGHSSRNDTFLRAEDGAGEEDFLRRLWLWLRELSLRWRGRLKRCSTEDLLAVSPVKFSTLVVRESSFL